MRRVCLCQSNDCETVWYLKTYVKRHTLVLSLKHDLHDGRPTSMRLVLDHDNLLFSIKSATRLSMDFKVDYKLEGE